MQIVRTLFGNKIQSNNPVEMRRWKMDYDIDEILKRKDLMPLDTFTFFALGEENHQYLLSKGFNSVLVDKKPYLYDIGRYCYGNKLKLLQYALNQFKEPILYLDMDCLPTAPGSSYELSELSFKTDFAACLSYYRARKCWWRTENPRTLPNGGFMYMKNLEVIDGIIKAWEELVSLNKPAENEEIAVMRWLDRRHGKWIGIEEYKKLYEPTGICSLSRMGAWMDKDAKFIHWIGSLPDRFEKGVGG